jgi:serine/threonine-protein kinase HipA
MTFGWGLVPAYDLLNVAIILPEDTEELALTLAGKKKKLIREHFELLGQGMGLTDRQIKGSFKRMQQNRKQAQIWIGQSFLSEGMKKRYSEVLEARYRQLGLIL